MALTSTLLGREIIGLESHANLLGLLHREGLVVENVARVRVDEVAREGRAPVRDGSEDDDLLDGGLERRLEKDLAIELHDVLRVHGGVHHERWRSPKFTIRALELEPAGSRLNQPQRQSVAGRHNQAHAFPNFSLLMRLVM